MIEVRFAGRLWTQWRAGLMVSSGHKRDAVYVSLDAREKEHLKEA